jgi:hypothetical protein
MQKKLNTGTALLNLRAIAATFSTSLQTMRQDGYEMISRAVQKIRKIIVPC